MQHFWCAMYTTVFTVYLTTLLTQTQSYKREIHPSAISNWKTFIQLSLGLVKDMKTIIAIALVISCVCAVASAQSCTEQAASLVSCINMLSTGGTSFCNDCGNPLFRYYRDCLGGNTTPVTTSEFNKHSFSILLLRVLCMYYYSSVINRK